jgi:HAD superfamily hydrolase (TIGR01490 family)
MRDPDQPDADPRRASDGAAPPAPGADRAAPGAASRAGDEGAGGPPSRNGRGGAAAFFDLDKTLMAGSSGIFFARAAYETGMISRGRLARDAYENLRYRLRGSTDDRADEVRRRVGEMIAGVHVRELQRLSPRVLAGVLPRLYPQMLARAYAHQDAGMPIYILTAASQEMADLLAHVLAFDGGLGSRSEIVDGRYTGRPAGPFNYREGKVLSMRELAASEGIDLACSYAYSDSESDLPMLRVVGHPVVVNPDSDLRRIAAEEGWEVLHLDRLGRRLKVGTAALAVLAIVGVGRLLRERTGAAAGPRA